MGGVEKKRSKTAARALAASLAAPRRVPLTMSKTKDLLQQLRSNQVHSNGAAPLLCSLLLCCTLLPFLAALCALWWEAEAPQPAHGALRRCCRRRGRRQSSAAAGRMNRSTSASCPNLHRPSNCIVRSTRMTTT